MNTPQDVLRAQLNKTTEVDHRGNLVPLSHEVIEGVIELIKGDTLERLTALRDPLCVGVTARGLLFVDRGRVKLGFEDIEDPDCAGDYHRVRERAQDQGVRLLSPVEARRVERATNSNFTPESTAAGFAFSLLESGVDPEKIFSTHPTWEYENSLWRIANQKGSHIRLAPVKDGAETRRGFSLSVDLSAWNTTKPLSGEGIPESLMAGYQDMISKHPGPHMDWPDIESIRATLEASAESIKGMSHPRIEEISKGKLVIGDDSGKPGVKISLIFPGEWRLLHK